jgi:hypothetical protein
MLDGQENGSQLRQNGKRLPVGMINYTANVRIHGEKIWPFTTTLMFSSLTIGHLLVLERIDKEEATLDAFK